MKKLLNISVVTAGAALILLTGCVSSRKYKASQNELAQARNDSAQLAQQVGSLNGNVQAEQNRNSALQRSLDSASSSYARQQKSLDYYQGYFKEQQTTMNQVSDDVKGALTQAGISNGDVQQVNNVVYVRLDENDLFKKNTTMMTTGGKQALDNLAQVIKNRSNVNVFVGGGDSAAAAAGTGNMPMDNNSGMSADAAPRPMHHHRTHVASAASGTASAQSGGASAQASGSVAANTSTGTAPAHKRVHHHYSSEGSMAIYSGPGHMHDRPWMLKQGRMVAVANHFLKNGVPKVNLSLQQPALNGMPDKTIKVVIMPKLEDFNPQMNATSAR
jgi:hypothetical protein